MTTSTKQHHLSWKDIERDCKRLAEVLRPHGPFAGIAAVTRGGMAPALLVAQLLDIRMIDTIAVNAYQDRKLGQPSLVKPPSLLIGDGNGWLVIDDLADTGATLSLVRPLAPKARFAALYAKPQGNTLLDHYVSDVEQDVWLVFPWEDL